MDFTGRIKFIQSPTSREYNGKVYRQQRILVTIDENTQYPQVIPFDLMEKLQDNVDQFKVGEVVTVHYNIRGNEYTNQKTNEQDSFLKLQAWRIDKYGAQQPQQNQSAAAYVPITQNSAPPANAVPLQTTYTPAPQSGNQGGVDPADDLPF